MDIEALFRDAERDYENKNFESAALKYSEIIDSAADHVGALEQRSMCYFHLSKLDESLQDMNRARDLEPNNPYRYSSRAYLKGMMKDLDGAIEDYRKAVHLDPKDAIAYNNLGLLLEQKGYKEQAEKNWEKADELAKSVKGSLTTSKDVDESIVNRKYDANSTSVQREIINVFTSKRGFAEFARFVLNGFKLKR